jgi:hypothetical protein
MKLKHNGVGIADMYTDEECFLLIRNMNDIEDKTRYTAPPDDESDPNEYHSAHLIHYLYKMIPDHDRAYEIHEVIEILQYAIDYIKDEDLGIDTI